MKKLMAHFLREERGVTAIEYGLIAGLIAIAIAVGASQLGTTLSGVFTQLTTCISSPSAKTCTLPTTD